MIQALIIDNDTMGLMMALANNDHPQGRHILVREIEARVAKIKAGVGRYPHLDAALQSAFTDNLRTRIDFDHDGKLVIERYTDEAKCWMHIMFWPDYGGIPWSVEQVIEKMNECDMQRWSTPAEYKRYKDGLSAKVREANIIKAQETMNNTLLSLGSKRLANFIEVERAFQTGERVTLHGEALKSIEHMVQSSANHERLVHEGLERGTDLARRWGMNLVGVDDQGQPVLDNPSSGE